MADLKEIITDLEARVASARRAADELPSLEQRLATARLLDAEYNGGEPPTADDEVDWTSLTRRNAVLLALQQASGPLSPADISLILKGRGRKSDEPNYISASLAKLKEAGKVVSTGFARWTTADREPPGDPRKGDLLGIPRREEGR